jgi:hypothetical protein
MGRQRIQPEALTEGAMMAACERALTKLSLCASRAAQPVAQCSLGLAGIKIIRNGNDLGATTTRAAPLMAAFVIRHRHSQSPSDVVGASVDCDRAAAGVNAKCSVSTCRLKWHLAFSLSCWRELPWLQDAGPQDCVPQ